MQKTNEKNEMKATNETSETKVEKMGEVIKNAMFAKIIVGARNSNLNGDPDDEGRPRQDAYDQHGKATNVSFNAKIRKYVMDVYGGVDGLDIFCRRGRISNNTIEEAWEEKEVKKLPEKEQKMAAQKSLLKRFWDNRVMGMVLDTGKKGRRAGKVTGPVQLETFRSVDPICITDECITRQFVANEKDEEKEQTMGNKSYVPFAAYQGTVSISPFEANRTGATEDDLKLYWEAWQKMFQMNVSSSRPMVEVMALVLFKSSTNHLHQRKSELDRMVQAVKKEGVKYPTDFTDYDIIIDTSNLHEEMEVIRIV